MGNMQKCFTSCSLQKHIMRKGIKFNNSKHCFAAFQKFAFKSIPFKIAILPTQKKFISGFQQFQIREFDAFLRCYKTLSKASHDPMVLLRPKIYLIIIDYYLCILYLPNPCKLPRYSHQKELF